MAIRHSEGNRISFGEPDGSKSERARRIAESLIAAGFRCPVTPRFRHEIWVKLLGNVAFNPISALTRATLEQIARHPDASRLVRELMVETEAVAAKLGIELPISIDQRMAGRREGGRAQDVDAAGPRGRAADGAGGRGWRSGGAGRTDGPADDGDARRVCHARSCWTSARGLRHMAAILGARGSWNRVGRLGRPW